MAWMGMVQFGRQSIVICYFSGKDFQFGHFLELILRYYDFIIDELLALWLGALGFWLNWFWLHNRYLACKALYELI